MSLSLSYGIHVLCSIMQNYVTGFASFYNQLESCGTKRTPFLKKTSWLDSLPPDSRTNLCFECELVVANWRLMFMFNFRKTRYIVFECHIVCPSTQMKCVSSVMQSWRYISYLCREKEVPFTVGGSFAHSENGANFASKGL